MLATKGVCIEEWQAAAFFQAREIIKSNPTDEMAIRVMKDFTNAMNTGSKLKSFAIFMLD